MKKKHTPIRMCIICRERIPKHLLQRYILSLNKNVALKATKQKSSGKGSYICSKETCWKKFQKLYIKTEV